MHFYPHNIADFNNATRHLTRVERSVYRDAIERYYDTEEPLPADDFQRLSRLLLCGTQEEKDALKFVLDEFFIISDGKYHHSRCDLEIAKYRLNSTAKARAGKASAEARKNKCSTPVEQPVDSVQQTNNQEPRTNNQKPKEKPLSAKKFTDADWAMAEQFHQSLVASIPGFKEPNLDAWANDIRLMRERDNRTPESILANWNFARQDQFWKTNVLCPATLRQQFDKLTAKSMTDGKPSLLMVSGWRPSPDSKEFLTQRGVDLGFAEDAIPEFELYWREKNQSCDNWDKKFRDHVLRIWARHVAALQHDTSPKRIDLDWQPAEQAYAALGESGVDELFAQSLVSEFVIFWRESNQMHNAWNAKFIAHAKQKWSQRLAPAAQLTRDISISQHLSDRSWAT